MAQSKGRSTRQRQAILDALREGERALTAEQIHQLARESLPQLALTTVYRNLDRLLEQGLIRAVLLPEGGAARYLPAGVHRHQLVCLGCERTVDLPRCPLEPVEAELEERTGFTIARHSLEIYGYCAQCRRRQQTGEEDS